MKTNLVNTCAYSGAVSIKTSVYGNVKDIVTVHNNGTINLFNGVVKALCGYSIDSARPHSVMLIKYAEEVPMNTSMVSVADRLTYPVRITGAVWGSAANMISDVDPSSRGIMSVNAIITSGSVFTSAESSPTDKNTLLLLNKDGDVLAYIHLDPIGTGVDSKSVISTITPTSDLLITWVLNFGNGVVS